MADYRVRVATPDGADALVRHRIAMFTDMGVPFHAGELDVAFRAWLPGVMTSGTYRAWLADAPEGGVAAGGGITIIPWPPGPRYAGDRLAFVYNVYTEPAHRKRGLGRMVMEAIHGWCREAGISSLALNASTFGRGMYERMGYQIAESPMMFLSLD